MKNKVCYCDLVLPNQLNHHNSMFGGNVCAIIDKAAANVVRRRTNQRFVTVEMDKIQFLEPIFAGDIVTVYGKITKQGTKSVTVFVEAFSEREGSQIKVTSSTVIFVAIGENNESIPFILREE
jgi:acyl-CoA thioesterase YciA